jgi:predicted dienelactone hydrolase
VAKARVASNVDASRSPIAVPYVILLVLALLGGVATVLGLTFGGKATAGGTGDAVPAVAQATATSFARTGPFGVGLATLTLEPAGTPVTVWYPANADQAHGVQDTTDLAALVPGVLAKLFPGVASYSVNTYGQSGLPVASGRFPLVVFSHGYGGWSTQSASLTAHLASWGFVVAAPEHTDRDLSAVLTKALTGSTGQSAGSNDVSVLEGTLSLMSAKQSDPSSIFYKHLDLSRIGAVGHSAGGAAVEKLAVADSRVKVFIGLAGASYGSFGETAGGLGAKAPDQPGMLMYGEKDGIVPAASMKNAYNAMNKPKRLIGVADAGHLVFADVCTIGGGQGGLVGVAKKVGLAVPPQLIALGSDGCSAAFAPVSTEQPLIKQAVTAEFRWAMGFDPNQDALNGLAAAYGWQVLQNTTAPSVAGAQAWSGGGS